MHMLYLLVSIYMILGLVSLFLIMVILGPKLRRQLLIMRTILLWPGILLSLGMMAVSLRASISQIREHLEKHIG